MRVQSVECRRSGPGCFQRTEWTVTDGPVLCLLPVTVTAGHVLGQGHRSRLVAVEEFTWMDSSSNTDIRQPRPAEDQERMCVLLCVLKNRESERERRRDRRGTDKERKRQRKRKRGREREKERGREREREGE